LFRVSHRAYRLGQVVDKNGFTNRFRLLGMMSGFTKRGRMFSLVFDALAH
jgi:hypothetical protein